jgi:hypothetical protein
VKIRANVEDPLTSFLRFTDIDKPSSIHQDIFINIKSKTIPRCLHVEASEYILPYMNIRTGLLTRELKLYPWGFQRGVEHVHQNMYEKGGTVVHGLE